MGFQQPSTVTFSSTIPMSWTDVHPDPSCMEGGLVWYGTWGGIHLHFFVDPERKQEFRVCLTGGEANTIAISYDYKGKYWTPITFPNYMCEYRGSVLALSELQNFCLTM